MSRYVSIGFMSCVVCGVEYGFDDLMSLSSVSLVRINKKLYE